MKNSLHHIPLFLSAVRPRNMLHSHSYVFTIAYGLELVLARFSFLVKSEIPLVCAPEKSLSTNISALKTEAKNSPETSAMHLTHAVKDPQISSILTLLKLCYIVCNVQHAGSNSAPVPQQLLSELHVIALKACWNLQEDKRGVRMSRRYITHTV